MKRFTSFVLILLLLLTGSGCRGNTPSHQEPGGNTGPVQTDHTSPPPESPAEGSSVEDGPTENGSAEDGPAEDGSVEDGSAEGGSAEDGSAENGSAENGSAGDGSAGGGSAEDGSAENGSAENGSAGDGSAGDGPQEVAPPEETPYIRIIDPSKPMVALTFDDGPDSTHTDEILHTLVEHHALATFFVVGRQAAAYPEVLTRLSEAGCEIGSHSYAHSQMTKMTKDDLLQDMAKADQIIQDATGSLPYLVRPPYGSINRTVAEAIGRPMICWNVDTEDWRSRDAQTVIDYIQNYGDLDGDVVLFHSIYQSTADAIKVLVPWLQEQGYQLVTVMELMSYYYGQWPQPGEIYYNYFNTAGRTGDPLPLPGPGQLAAQPAAAPAPSSAPSSAPPEEPPAQELESPPAAESQTPPQEPPAAPPAPGREDAPDAEVPGGPEP